MKRTYSVYNLVLLLLNKIWFIAVFTLVFGLGAFFVFQYLVEPRYESSVTMYVKNHSVTEANIDLDDLNVSKSLASTYITVLNSDAVMEQVGVKLTSLYDLDDLALMFDIVDGKPSASSVKRCFTMTSVDDTEVIQVKANTLDPRISAAMCNIMAEIAPEFLIRVVGAGSVEVIDTAVPKPKPVFPHVSMLSLMGAMIGFVIAVWLIIITDVLDDTVKDTNVLSQRYHKAILGEVQMISAQKAKTRHRYLLTDNGIPSHFAESYQSIRFNTMFALGTTHNKVIAVSSSNPSEGKSTTAANIAVALAQTDHAVLLIDADLRKPTQHKLFRTGNADGLSTVIIRKSTIKEAVKANVINGLDLLTSGPIPPNPSELLSSGYFQELLGELAETYEYVVIDTPPVNVVSDALVMKDSVSGMLLVLKYASTTYEDISGCMKQLELAKMNMLGFVLNGIDEHK